MPPSGGLSNLAGRVRRGSALTEQETLTASLASVFPGVPVKSEWAALSGEGATYSPRVDIAVGPFATQRLRYEDRYSELARSHGRLLAALHDSFAKNVADFGLNGTVPGLEEMLWRNPNARCFLAIEIERTGSRKHIMGGAINASALGRLGVSAACSPERLRTLLRIRRYLLFLAGVGKNTFDSSNLLIVTTQQLAESVCEQNSISERRQPDAPYLT